MEKMPDYCSSAPDSILGVDISESCKMHDLAYKHQNLSRAEADWDFFVDLAMTRWWMFPFACVYYVAVRLFGSSHY